MMEMLMELKRFHREVMFPENFDALMEKFMAELPTIRYSQHAKYATINDRYHIIPIIDKTMLDANDCFEIFMDGEQIVKAVFRKSDTAGFDNSYSVSREGTIVTCWTNKRDDSHKTLNKKLYAQTGNMV